jgi:outer membrane lipoprotein-sorting protein
MRQNIKWEGCMSKYMAVGGFVLLFALSVLSSAYAVELTADMITKEGKITRNGKIYVKGNKCRVEKGSTPMYVIVRGDKGLFWQINNAEKTYIKAKLTPDMMPTIEEKIAGETARKAVGAETVNGYATKKYEVTAKKGKKTETIQQWFSTEYGFPVKVVGSNWSVEYKNIKKGGVADNLFELAPGLIEDTTEVPDVLH